MSHISCRLALLLGLSVFSSAQTSVDSIRPATSDSPYVIIPVAESLSQIQEESLVFNAEVLGRNQTQAIPGNKPVGENSLMTERTSEPANAMRCYGFLLAKGETLKLRLKGKTEGKIGMRFLPKTPADGMTSQVKRANMSPSSLRKSRIEITNITTAPYQVVLMLYGQANYPYIIEIERVKK